MHSSHDTPEFRCAWPPRTPLGSPSRSEPFYARAFGDCADDAEFDLAAWPRPTVVNEILKCCLSTPTGEPYRDDAIWDWTVDERLQGLLAVVMAGGERKTELVARCGHGGCGESMVLSLDLTMFVREPAPDTFNWSPNDTDRCTVGLPRGNDQRRWNQARLEKPQALFAAMAQTLVREVNGAPPAPTWTLPPTWMNGLETALAEHDPLTALTLDARCPACGSLNTIAFDVEAWLLEQLAQRQQALLSDVHRLAFHYHWSEQAIMALPRWRRAFYLHRLSTEASL